MYRITNPDLKPGAPVVFLQHGLVDTADAWIINHPDQAPAFVFARKGYDVWLGNSRGHGIAVSIRISTLTAQIGKPDKSSGILAGKKWLNLMLQLCWTSSWRAQGVKS